MRRILGFARWLGERALLAFLVPLVWLLRKLTPEPDESLVDRADLVMMRDREQWVCFLGQHQVGCMPQAFDSLVSRLKRLVQPPKTHLSVDFFHDEKLPKRMWGQVLKACDKARAFSVATIPVPDAELATVVNEWRRWRGYEA